MRLDRIVAVVTPSRGSVLNLDDALVLYVVMVVVDSSLFDLCTLCSSDIRTVVFSAGSDSFYDAFLTVLADQAVSSRPSNK